MLDIVLLPGITVDSLSSPVDRANMKQSSLTASSFLLKSSSSKEITERLHMRIMMRYVYG